MSDERQLDPIDQRIPERYRLQPLDPEQNPSEPVAPADEEEMGRAGRFLAELLQVILPAVVLAVVVHLFLAQATVVFGQSMEPNLSPEQRLIVEKISYRLGDPQRNDIVVIDLPQMEDMLVKRVMGLPGEVVELREGQLFINGVAQSEPFPHDLDYASMAPIRLAPDEYFVMGDNRDNSNDSRAFGPITRAEIEGRVWLRYWPLRQFTLF